MFRVQEEFVSEGQIEVNVLPPEQRGCAPPEGQLESAKINRREGSVEQQIKDDVLLKMAIVSVESKRSKPVPTFQHLQFAELKMRHLPVEM